MLDDSVAAGATDMPTETAGEATVDSAPSERTSEDGENGLDANDENSVHLPSPLYQIDEAASEDGVKGDSNWNH